MEDSLIKYIKECKSKNISDEEIIRNLTLHNWPIEKIKQAFLQINPIPVSTTISDQSVSLTKNDVSPTEKKPKIINIISIFIFLIASLYIFKLLGFLGIIVIMGKSLSGNGLVVFSVIKYFPSFGILLILFSFVTFFTFYFTFKIRNGSKKSFFLGLLFLLIVPTLSSFIAVILIAPIAKLGAALNTTQASSPLKPVNFLDPIFILNIVSVILLVISYKKFHFNNVSLSKKAKVFLIIIFTVIFVPSGLIIFSDYAKSFDTDYGYTNAKASVNYHIYRPKSLPDNLSYATKFSLGNEFAGRQNGVRVGFDIPFDKIIKGEKTKPIVMNQVIVESGFDIDRFSSTFIKDVNPQKIKILKSVNQNGYLFQKKFGTANSYFIVFMTNDNILISLGSINASPEELAQLAESLQ